MTHMTVTKEVAANPAALWKVLADFGDISWIPMASDIKIEGDGPGMRRIIGASNDVPVIEQLEAIDPEQRSLTYQIVQGGPAPVSLWRSTATVGDGSITWAVEYEPNEGATAAEIEPVIDMIYGMMAGWLQDAAGSNTG